MAEKCKANCSGPTCSKEECNHLCIHMYTCDKACYDFSNGHICKHIHHVHSINILQSKPLVTTIEHMSNQPSSEDVSLDESYEFDPLEYAEAIISPQHGMHIYNNCGHISVSLAIPYLDHINSCLHNAILSCRAAIEAEKSPNATFPTPEKIPATKKPQHQWHFQKTTKTPGRKCNGLNLR